MGLLDKFKKIREKTVGDKKIAGKVIDKQGKPEKKASKPKAKKEESKSRIIKKETVDTGMAYRNLMRPLVSEKATFLTAEGKYVFVVSPEANKIEIKKAVQNVYSVKVKDVNIINMRGKRVRFGRSWGKTNNWKKAIVTLEPGEKIELYEGV